MGTVEVIILGQQYKITGEAPDEYIHELARYVDAQIRDVCGKNPSISPMKASILAALNIADELQKYKKEQESLTKDIEEKTEQLVKLFE
jgi:cell division protein ZapA (FtsZ GTPase activity inhibitor)